MNEEPGRHSNVERLGTDVLAEKTPSSPFCWHCGCSIGPSRQSIEPIFFRPGRTSCDV